MFSKGQHSIIPALLAGTILFFSGVVHAADEPQIEWKTLPEYMAMDRDAQLELILKTRRIVMRKIAQTDFPRAECIGGLFDFRNSAGEGQLYDVKGLLKKAAEQNDLFPDWKAQQVVAYVIQKHLCPPVSS